MTFHAHGFTCKYNVRYWNGAKIPEITLLVLHTRLLNTTSDFDLHSAIGRNAQPFGYRTVTVPLLLCFTLTITQNSADFNNHSTLFNRLVYIQAL